MIKGAVLDVFYNEPLSAESLLWSLPNVFITPHCVLNEDSYAKTLDIFIDNLKRYSNNE